MAQRSPTDRNQPVGGRRSTYDRVVKISVGPYTFSGADAASTQEIAQALLDLYPEPAQAELLSLRTQVASVAGSGAADEVIGELFPLLLSGREAAARAGVLPAKTSGTVTQLNVSDGGVPKTPVESVEVDFRGVTSDRQRNRVHHGRPFQALCLWSAEIIADLQADGHPIAAGSAGENITIGGIDWPTLCMGTQLRIGEVLAQVSSYAVPCGHQAKWFSDGDISRLHHDNGDISRLYATVIEPGRIAAGDQVLVEP